MFQYTSRLPRVFPVLLLVFAIQLPLCGEAAPSSLEQGVSALRAADYHAAVRYLEQARAAGIDTAGLHYNLGVAYYRLERYRDAEAAFAKVARTPEMAALAHYNLGLVAAAQQDTRKAERLFDQALKESDSAKLSALAASQLKRIRREDPVRRNGFLESLSGIVSGEVGYDDNVTLDANDLSLATGKDDTYLSLFLYGDGVIAKNLDSTVRADASLYSVRYNDLGSYNQDDLEAGIGFETAKSGWNLDAGVRLGVTYLDGNNFTRAEIIRLQGSRKLSEQQTLRLRYEVRRIDDMDAAYAYLAGWRQQLGADSIWKDGGKRLRVGYRLELNDREDLLSPRFTSYSPTRHNLRAQGVLPVSEKLDAVLELQYRYSRYNDANALPDGSFVTREEHRYRAIAKAVYAFNRNTDMALEYIYTKNDANLADKNYTDNQYSLNISYLW